MRSEERTAASSTTLISAHSSSEHSQKALPCKKAKSLQKKILILALQLQQH